MQRHGFHYSFTQIPSQPRTEEAVPSEHPGQNIDLVTASSPGSYHHELNTPRQGDNPSIYYSHSGTQWPVQSSSALDVVSEPAYQQDGNIQDSQSSNLTGYVHAQSMSNWWAVNDPSFAHVRLLHGDPMRYATELQPSAFPPPNHVATEWIHPNAQPMPGSAPQRITQSFETLAERTGHYDHHHFQTTAPLNQNVQYNSLPRSFPIVNDTVAEPGARVHEGISSGTISHAGHTVSPSFHLRGMPQHHIASSSGNLTTGEGVIVGTEVTSSNISRRRSAKGTASDGQQRQQYHCNSCLNKYFSRPEDLMRHSTTASAHRGDTSHTFTCEVCGTRCSRQDALRRHGRNKHKANTFPCDDEII